MTTTTSESSMGTLFIPQPARPHPMNEDGNPISALLGTTLPRVGPFAIQRSWRPGEAAGCPRLEGNG